MHWVLGVMGLLGIIAITHASFGLAWTHRVHRKFDGLFAICHVCSKTNDHATWQRALDAVDKHLNVIKEYNQWSPLYWHRHWNDDWLAEVKGGSSNERSNALLN
jgi:hypothetical protein